MTWRDVATSPGVDDKFSIGGLSLDYIQNDKHVYPTNFFCLIHRGLWYVFTRQVSLQYYKII